MKHNLENNNEFIMVIKTFDGHKALRIYFDDDNKSYKIDPIRDDYYDNYEDRYTE